MRCEACGSRTSGADTVRAKMLGKVRELCSDCGTILEQARPSMTPA